MKVHDLRLKIRKRSKRRGRGYSSGCGSTSGRGHKGELARAGHKIPVGFEGGQTKLSRRLPKRRGFHNKWKKPYLAISIEKLNIFQDKSKVALENLIEKGICAANVRRVKIVANGDISKKLTLVNLPVTKKAKELIEKAGGEVLC